MNYSGLRVTVMGLGSFGGGVGAVRFLASRGASVTVTDLKPAEKLAGSLAQIAELDGITLRLGQHRDADFLEAHLVVVSPAVPRDNRFVMLAKAAGIPVTSEMNLFWQHNRGRVVGITGSNGKSTTAALTHVLLSANRDRRCWLGGNIGRSLLPVVDQIRPDEWVVLELSSFQLDDLSTLPSFCGPEVAVVTNFSPNHLDRHGTLDAYRTAKQQLLARQRSNGIAVLNQDNPDVRDWPTVATRLGFGMHDGGQPGCFADDERPGGVRAIFRNGARQETFPLGNWLRLPGAHNLQNALAASCVALTVGATVTDLESGLREFSGLPHRLEFVGEAAGRRFYNDSKATTPAAVHLALAAFDRPIVLLAGGYDKQIDLAELAADIVRSRVRGVALLGQTASCLDRSIQEQDPQGAIARYTARDFQDACAWAARLSRPGDVVLLSPGCASYDWFDNHESRGRAFVEWVRSQTGAGWKS